VVNSVVNYVVNDVVNSVNSCVTINVNENQGKYFVIKKLSTPLYDGAFNYGLWRVMHCITPCWLNILVSPLSRIRHQFLLNQQFIFSYILNRPLTLVANNFTWLLQSS
jgi:hypothetical protein